MTKMMDAALMYGPGDIRVERLPVPQCPEGGFLVEVDAIGMCGSDIRNLTSDSRSGAYPWVYGHEVVGRVAEVASGVTQYTPGQWVYVYPLAHCLKCENCRSGHSEQCSEVEDYTASPGGFAQYIAYSAKRVDRGATFELPDDVDPIRATLAEPLSSTYACVENIDVKMGDSVVILGSGPVGLMLAILCRMRGASQVIVTDTNQARLDKAAAFDIDALVNSAETDAVAEVLRLTGGRGASKVISANPSTQGQQQALYMAAKAGTVVFFGGVPKGSLAELDTNLIHYNGLWIYGHYASNTMQVQRAFELSIDPRFPADKLITHVLPLSEINRALELARTGEALKSVLLPNGEIHR